MSEPKVDSDISFEEFKEMCGEAGISVDNPEMLEQDFRSGRALADVTDALVADIEAHPAQYSENEHIQAMDIAMTLLAESATTEVARKMATRLAVQALRYLSEYCHDEGQN